MGTRLDDTWESSRKRGPFRRLRLRRADGAVYLDRWGIGHDRIGRVLLHRMQAGDPGIDLHDHPWWFVTIPLWGGYTEIRANIRDAAVLAVLAETWPHEPRGTVEHRRPFRPRTMRLDECHTVAQLTRRTCWTLVIGGPRRRRWGFYLPSGYIDEATYDATVRADRRDLFSEQGGGPVSKRHTVKACGKRRYRSQDEAVRALHTLANTSTRERRPQRAYECPKCKGWHLTSQREGRG